MAPESCGRNSLPSRGLHMDRKPHLLLLPGMLCDGAFWQSQMDGLADICTSAVISFGTADNMGAMAQIVLAEAPETFALAGHSMGGRVALEVYRRAPRRVARLGLFCTDYRGHVSDEARRQEVSVGEGLMALARSEGMMGVARRLSGRALPPDRQEDKSLVSAVEEMIARHSPQVLAAQIKAGVTRPDFTDLLPTITCPTLICAGEKDVMRPVEVHREMAAKIPSSRLAVIARGGHMVAMEYPRAVTAAMRDWLQS
jgi:pimeloyl-ACP methyl ester carboxylesterase